MSYKWLESSEHHGLDCGDNSCMYRDTSKPGGMRTNGGCRCADNKGRYVERFLLSNYLKALEKIIQLEADLAMEEILK